MSNDLSSTKTLYEIKEYIVREEYKPSKDNYIDCKKPGKVKDPLPNTGKVDYRFLPVPTRYMRPEDRLLWGLPEKVTNRERFPMPPALLKRCAQKLGVVYNMYVDSGFNINTGCREPVLQKIFDGGIIPNILTLNKIARAVGIWDFWVLSVYTDEFVREIVEEKFPFDRLRFIQDSSFVKERSLTEQENLFEYGSTFILLLDEDDTRLKVSYDEFKMLDQANMVKRYRPDSHHKPSYKFKGKREDRIKSIFDSDGDIVLYDGIDVEQDQKGRALEFLRERARQVDAENKRKKRARLVSERDVKKSKLYGIDLDLDDVDASFVVGDDYEKVENSEDFNSKIEIIESNIKDYKLDIKPDENLDFNLDDDAPEAKYLLQSTPINSLPPKDKIIAKSYIDYKKTNHLPPEVLDSHDVLIAPHDPVVGQEKEKYIIVPRSNVTSRGAILDEVSNVIGRKVSFSEPPKFRDDKKFLEPINHFSEKSENRFKANSSEWYKAANLYSYSSWRKKMELNLSNIAVQDNISSYIKVYENFWQSNL